MLFDVDGTLMHAGTAGRSVFERAVEAVLGGLPDVSVRMGGKTDPLIVREYLALAGASDPAHFGAVIRRLEHETALAAGEIAIDGRACAGVPQLLSLLSADERLHLSVLTGNIAPNAVVKLSAFGLDRWLDLETGAYGSDSEDRKALVPIALERVKALRGVHLRPDDVWVIGDTPRDCEC
ncbi:MAG TPA: haloacid dehalogenase-like hydrolase, partial [Acidimicrobiales bacterium]|nr:haloacid dehalogenase-like hydrolase [Acidimicrobiales bacterium]